jgi:membrane AbrB-like protein
MTNLWRAVFALALGTASGWIAAQVGLPLPWMLGPMIGTTLAAMVHAPVRGPKAVRPFVIPAIGVMLGSSVTVEVLAGVGRWWATMVLLVPFLFAAAAVSYVIYRRVGGFDRTTAFFCAMPGGLNDMLVMGAEQGGDERRIALAHGARILVVISFVVLFFGLVLGVSSGAEERAARWIPLDALSASDWVILTLCGALGAALGHRIGLPAAAVFGPMILSAAVHLAGWVTVAPPTLIVNAAQIVIGTVVGCRFVGTPVWEILRNLGLGVLSSCAMIAVALGFAEVVHLTTGIALSQAFLAYSPGGLAEMSLLALAMHQDVAYVSVTHVVRLVLVIGGAGYVFRLLRRGF